MNNTIKILLGPSSFGAIDKSPLIRLGKKGLVVIDNPFKRKLKKEELFDLLEGDVTGIIAGLEPLDREVMEKSQLKVISRCGSGLSNVDMQAADDLGIKVYSTPYGPTNAVAELTIASVLSLLRDLHHVNNSMHSKKWDKRIGNELKGKKFVIIGYGRIGRRVGKLASAFGAEIVAVDPEFTGDGTAIKMELDEALKTADIVSLHSSGVSEMIGKNEFKILKDGVILLNAGRGELISEDELIKGLDSGKVKGAWLDTFLNEPYTGPLCDYESVILTSHIGSYTAECRMGMENEAVDNLFLGLGIS